MPRNKRAGVLLIEVELLKPPSRHKRVAVELAWPDMLSLPLLKDTLQIDRAEVCLTAGPADDETILDSPQSLTDFTWQGSFDSDEWISAQAFAVMANKDRNVLSARIIQ
jgi:hypothetical protein